MKIMILGSSGMAGNMISSYFKNHSRYEIINVARNSKLSPAKHYINIEHDLHLLKQIILNEAPFVIINCIGLLVKDSNDNPERAIYINSYFPHWLESITKSTNTKIIHISTDCVFDGRKGFYSEKDIPNETNWYGRSKALGELNNYKDLTIRTSIIGTELKENGSGLLEWALRQKETVNGYSNCFWNGVTTFELAKFIDYMLLCKPDISGIYHLTTPNRISKADLLELIYKTHYGHVKVNPIANPVIDKTLVNTRSSELKYITPDYIAQLRNLYDFNKEEK